MSVNPTMQTQPFFQMTVFNLIFPAAVLKTNNSTLIAFTWTVLKRVMESGFLRKAK